MKFRICPLCGATLDHGERCDCERENTPDELEARRPVKRKSYDALYAQHMRIDCEEARK